MTTVDDILAHHGVKGQKWGVRRAAAKVAKGDAKFAKNAGSNAVTFKIYNAMANQMNHTELPRINSKPQYQDMTGKPAVQKKYDAEVQKSFIAALDKGAQGLGTNASGTKRYGVVETDGGGWDVVLHDVQHAADVLTHVNLTRNNKGHIIAMKLVAPLEHSADLVSDFLEHHGVKGQKWGVRRKLSELRTGSNKPPAHVDAVLAKAHKQTVKKGSTDALSTKELQALVTRMNLEKQFKSLKPATPAEQIKKQIEKTLVDAGKQHLSEIITKEASKQIAGLFK
jgi:hypothetical protein